MSSAETHIVAIPTYVAPTRLTSADNTYRFNYTDLLEVTLYYSP